MSYTYKTKAGNLYTVSAKDADRGRCAAKRVAINAGDTWSGAKLVRVSNSLG